MRWLLYFRLIVLTAGTLLSFFWMILILGHRRQRNFERVFFFLCLALTCFCGSNLLELNAELYYGAPSHALQVFAWTFLCLGLWFLPSLIVHLHVEYASLRGLIGKQAAKQRWLLASYFPAFVLSRHLLAALLLKSGFGFAAPSHTLGSYFQVWLVAAIIIAAYWQWRFKGISPDREQRIFHTGIFWYLLFAVGCLLVLFYQQQKYGPSVHTNLGDQVLLWLVVIPLMGLTRDTHRYNFLQIGHQRNLIYAVFGVFIALLYLSFVRRASLWLELYLPPEASAALLLFLPVIFFEPLQRMVKRSLLLTAQTEVDRAQKLMGPINEVARRGDQETLREFAERWIAEQLQLAEVRLELGPSGPTLSHALTASGSAEESFIMTRTGQYVGRLRVRGFGAMISGETYAGLELICEQLPAAFDLCRLIEEKLQLERELAERERLALVGQMAASISHNLKNPLGSIKTILQVQMESPELPLNLRRETQMVLDEISRLSARLNQLLQFSRPTVLGGTIEATCDIRAVIIDVLNVLRPEAERRHVRLGSRITDGASKVDASPEALHDVISNLVVNAIEASPPEGEVKVELSWLGLPCMVSVEDEGNGIPPDLREKVLQPFFTTKPHGTGLGLAIVAKRVAELGGELRVASPVKDGRGTRFELKLWPAFMQRGSGRAEVQV
jgi:signal transduction histidine kinase